MLNLNISLSHDISFNGYIKNIFGYMNNISVKFANLHKVWYNISIKLYAFYIYIPFCSSRKTVYINININC